MRTLNRLRGRGGEGRWWSEYAEARIREEVRARKNAEKVRVELKLGA